MAGVAARLSIADYAHRTLVSTLFGLSVYGCYGIYAMHTERLRMGVEALAKHEAEEAYAKANGIILPPEFYTGPMPPQN